MQRLHLYHNCISNNLISLHIITYILLIFNFAHIGCRDHLFNVFYDKSAIFALVSELSCRNMSHNRANYPSICKLLPQYESQLTNVNKIKDPYAADDNSGNDYPMYIDIGCCVNL